MKIICTTGVEHCQPWICGFFTYDRREAKRTIETITDMNFNFSQAVTKFQKYSEIAPIAGRSCREVLETTVSVVVFVISFFCRIMLSSLLGGHCRKQHFKMYNSISSLVGFTYYRMFMSSLFCVCKMPHTFFTIPFPV